MGLSTGISQAWQLPLFQIVVDGSKAGTSTDQQPALLVGQAFCGGDAVSAAKAGMAGNGTLTLDNATPVLQGSATGLWKVVFTSATAFNVVPPVAGMSQGAGQVGQPYVGPGIKFTIAAGATAFAVGDEFDITVNSLPTGNGAYNVPVPMASPSLAKVFWGEGSILERMVSRFFDGNTTQQLWAIAVPRPAAGTKAGGSYKIASQQTASGVLTRYIAGQKVQITVYQTDTQATVAANLAAAVNAMTTLPVTAAVDGTDSTKVNLTCRWHGLSGNDITLVSNYLGANGNEVDPVGLTTLAVPMAGGTGTPDFTGAISAIQSKEFVHVAMPYSDAASLQSWDAEMGFGPTGRWANARQQYGWVYNVRRDTYANLLVWGLAQNSPVISTGAVEQAVPTPVWELTAAYCAQGAAGLTDDPARPLQTLELYGCLPAPVDQQFSQAQRNNLVGAGLAAFGVAPSGNIMILREQCQYQRNSYGQGDTAFSLLTTLAINRAFILRVRYVVTTKYPRHKLGQDSVNYGPGQKIMTPSLAKSEMVAVAVAAEKDGLIQNVPLFKRNLLVEIDDNNPNRLNVLLGPQLMGQLRQFAALQQFRLLADPSQV
jgi:phage tail sheath gpL-like